MACHRFFVAWWRAGEGRCHLCSSLSSSELGAPVQAETRMVGRPFVWLLGASTNLLAAWISRAPPCPAAPT
eukprot:28783-Pyramimonas_sp.AAC.1